MRKATSIAAVVAVVWSLIYIGIWMSVSGCGRQLSMACLDAPVRPIQQFVMLNWVESYQTLLAGILTLAAALYAATPVYRQRAEQRRQSAATAIPIALRLAKEQDQLVEKFQQLTQRVTKIKYHLWDYDNSSSNDLRYNDWLGTAQDDLAVLVEVDDFLKQRLAQRSGEGWPIVEGINRTTQLHQQLALLIDAVRKNMFGPDYEYGETDPPEGEERLRRNTTSEAIDEWLVWSPDYLEANGAAAFKAWTIVRELERSAVPTA